MILSKINHINIKYGTLYSINNLVTTQYFHGDMGN